MSRGFPLLGVVVVLALASQAEASPRRARVAVLEQKRPQRTVALDPLGAAELAMLYASVGRELKRLEQAKSIDATIDLWPRYRWIRINDAMTTADKRLAAATLLQRLRSEMHRR